LHCIIRCVKRGHAGRLLPPLENDLARVLDAPGLELARRALAGGEAAVTAHGSLIVGGPGGRRLVEVDRHGTLLAALRWSAAGLDAAWLRLPDRRWLRIEARAAREAPWGIVDRVWLTTDLAATGTALTVFESPDYLHLERIPTLAEPARLPPGAGAVVLNLIAALAADQRRATLAYRGPYPGEQLFLTLLESFRYDTADADPLGVFTAGALHWRPAPHERVFAGDGVSVQLRGRIEKVVWRRRAYYRPDWQGVTRVAPRRVHDVDDGVRCSLWALGAALGDQLALERDGAVRGLLESAPPPAEIRALPAAVPAAVGALVAAGSSAALGPLIETAARRIALEWGPVAGDLAEVGAGHARVSGLVRARVGELLDAAPSRAERAAVGLAALTELAHLLGDSLRADAQEELLARPLDEQRTLLAAPPRPSPDAARRITDGVEALLADVAS
jgi:hypothetical protein